ncbi:MAG TPA: SCO family protein [Candidatus Acidoferrales bacterium]|nr:SCO family protein [Candidatus Acidoferrales bacterium]
MKEEGRRRRACGGAVAALAVLMGGLAAPPAARAQAQALPIMQNPAGDPAVLKKIGLDQKLNAQVPLDLAFRDEKGNPVALRQFFGKRPVILTLVYYQCPMLCTLVLNGVLNSAKRISLEMGKDYEVVTVSIDPTEKPILAEAKHTMYAGLYGRPGAVEGWHFLTGEEGDIEKLAASVGYRYAYDKASEQFAHPSGIMVLTPEGRVSRYFYGIEYSPRDVRLALVEASGEKIGTPVDEILLACFHYDPTTGKYGLVISRVIRLAGIATVLAIGGVVLVLRRKEHYAAPEEERSRKG